MNYTSVEQSRKLAEVLSHETADNTYERIIVAGCNIDIPVEQQYIHRDIPFTFYSGVGIPCWSIKALLNELPADITKDGHKYHLKFEKLHHKEEGWTKYIIGYYNIDNTENDKSLMSFENSNFIDCIYDMVMWYYNIFKVLS